MEHKYTYQYWEERLSAYADSVEKNLEEIRKCKADIQQMQEDNYFHETKGHYIRDDQRIILSAPEIIIGDVDAAGTLYAGSGSTVIIRGSQVGLQGAGQGGQVELRAPGIVQKAEDPGGDGLEHVVYLNSEITSLARNITIQSNDTTGAFSSLMRSTAGSGISIHADKTIDVKALAEAESREKRLDDLIKQLEADKKNLKEQASSHKKAYKTICERMTGLLDKKDELITDDDSVRSDYNDIKALNIEIEGLSMAMSEEIHNYAEVLGMLSETNRQIDCFKEEKKTIVKGDDFKKKSTGTTVNIAAENFNLTSMDGEGNLRTNEGAGIDITSQAFNVAAVAYDGKLMENGKVSINAKTVKVGAVSATDQKTDDKCELTKATYTAEGDFIVTAKNITFEGMDYEVADKKLKEKALTADGKISMRAKTVEVSTENSANVEVDDKGKLTKANYTAEGDIIVRSKTVTVESVDYDVENGKKKEKALTKESKVSIRTEKGDFSATDTEGKATGSVNINAKAVAVKSMDVEKEKRTDKKLVEGSSMLLFSEKMFIGAKSKDMKSKKVQAQSEEIALFANKTLEAQQGEAKAILQLADGNAAVSGSKTQIYGETTVNAKTEIKGELKAPKAAIDSVEAKSAFKSPNISDGMAAGAGGGGGSLSAKLKAEEAPKES